MCDILQHNRYCCSRQLASLVYGDCSSKVFTNINAFDHFPTKFPKVNPARNAKSSGKLFLLDGEVARDKFLDNFFLRGANWSCYPFPVFIITDGADICSVLAVRFGDSHL